MLAPPTRIDCGCSTTQAREEGASHVDYRRRLSSELSADCFYGSGNWGVRRTAIESQRWRSRALLPGAKAKRNQRARGDGGHGLLTLVRAVTGGVGYRGVDWRCGGDQEAARPETENRPPRCPTFAEVAARKSLSSNLGTESGES